MLQDKQGRPTTKGVVNLRRIMSIENVEHVLISIIGIVIYASPITLAKDNVTYLQDIVLIDKSCFAVMLTISSHFIYGPNALDNIKDAIPFLICGLTVEKNNDGISLRCGIDTTITIDPRCKKARRMMCWFLKHRFAQYKVNWIKRSSFSLFITLKISNARRTTINEFMNMDHVWLYLNYSNLKLSFIHSIVLIFN
ncbi:uncharacterized protein LOC104886324 isoform X1 [Beta vulgaris subsp. vulgaris]|uniref:uncharacterized protein LOC104886324 isoform X1 n=1 Tax=Beta vulgaris subsp. vulgaris TaxID=3555 RepID=UPI0025487607|nr:uncharacterized protein LOC104886324 isoform X1 [Beta vulgaris subsp. vulgaris]